MTKERLAYLATQAAIMQSDCDHDWAFFEDRVEELNKLTDSIPNGPIKAAVGLVVVQAYLNSINRMLEEAEAEVAE